MGKMNDNAIICEDIKDIFKYLESISVLSFPHAFSNLWGKIPINKQKTDTFSRQLFRLLSMFPVNQDWIVKH